MAVLVVPDSVCIFQFALQGSFHDLCNVGDKIKYSLSLSLSFSLSLSLSEFFFKNKYHQNICLSELYCSLLNNPQKLYYRFISLEDMPIAISYFPALFQTETD